MRTLRSAFMAVLVINLVAVLAFAGWLGTTERLSKQRLRKAVEVFKLTVDQEQQQDEQARVLEEKARKLAEEAAHLETVGQGVQTIPGRLAEEQQRNEITLQRLDRMQREKEDLLRQLQAAKDLIARQQSELEAKRQAFDAAIQRELRLRDDRDFRQAVEMYEQLRPRQAKEMLQDLLRQNKAKEVVDYLGAMQLRKAAAVLKEFRTAEEVAQATDLVQKLRERGIDLLQGAARGAGTAAPLPEAPTSAAPATQPGGAT